MIVNSVMLCCDRDTRAVLNRPNRHHPRRRDHRARTISETATVVTTIAFWTNARQPGSLAAANGIA
jgi:hypothetical protein